MKFYKGISKLEGLLVGIVTALLVLVVFIQVLNRGIIKATISWPEEAARYLMVWQVFLASVIAFRKGANCYIDVLVNRLHGKSRIAMGCFANVVCLVFAFIVVSTSLEVIQSQIMFNQTSTALNINMAFVYAALPVWGVLFILELAFMTIQLFRPGTFTEKSVREGPLA